MSLVSLTFLWISHHIKDTIPTVEWQSQHHVVRKHLLTGTGKLVKGKRKRDKAKYRHSCKVPLYFIVVFETETDVHLQENTDPQHTNKAIYEEAVLDT